MSGVSLRDVTYVRRRGRAELRIFEGFNLEVRAGEALAVMGRSGIGKSTLINLVAGYLRPTSGTISEGPKPIWGPERTRVVVFQSGGLWPWLTLEKNVALGLGRFRRDGGRRAAMDLLLERLEIADARDALPGELSGGMRKRAELARAILASPRVLMLDEALSSVDPVTKQICIDVIGEFRRAANSAVIVVSHDIDEVLHIADRVMVLSGYPPKVGCEIEPAPDGSKHEIMRAQILGALGYTS